MNTHVPEVKTYVFDVKYYLIYVKTYVIYVQTHVIVVKTHVTDVKTYVFGTSAWNAMLPLRLNPKTALFSPGSDHSGNNQGTFREHSGNV